MATTKRRKPRKRGDKDDAGHFNMLAGGLRPVRWLPPMDDIVKALPLLQLRAHGIKQWSGLVRRARSQLVTNKPAQLWQVFGANLTGSCAFILAFDQAHDEDPNPQDKAVYSIGPVGPMAPYSLELPRGSRRFKFGIFLIPSTDPTFFKPVAGADATYQYEYLEVR